MHLDMIFKAFVGILVAVVIIGSGLGVINAFSQNVAVDNYMETVAKVIIESNYNQNVINSCISEAASNGYILMVTVDGSERVGVRNYATIKLTYYFEIPLFGIRQKKIQIKTV